MRGYKKDFPIFKTQKNLVYLDSAATSQKPQSVIDAINDYYQTYNANIHRGIYPIAEKATKKVEEVRKKVARFINAASPEEIIFTKGTTEGINLLMYAFGLDVISEGDKIVTTIMEHHANFVPWQQLAIKKNAEFRVVDITDDGKLDKENIRQLTRDADFFAFTYVSNMLGTINEVSKIIKDIRKHNKKIKILIDAAQAVPHTKVDVQDLDCDFLAFSGHKMLAETGVGVLYGKKKLLNAMRPFLFGGLMIREVAVEQTTFAQLPYKLEAGTMNIAGIISLGAAIDYLQSIGMDAIQQNEKQLAMHCIEELDKLGNISIYGPRGAFARSGIVAFNVAGVHAHDVSQILADQGICVRAGHHCAMPLHTWLGISASVRASFYIYNDEQDVEKLIKGIKKVKKIFSV